MHFLLSRCARIVCLTLFFLVLNVTAQDRTALKVSPNGRYFLNGLGEPFFYFGDTQWDIWQEVTLDGARGIIEDRKAKGFNVFNVMIVGTSDGKSPNKPGQVPFLNNNPTTPNPAYFQTVDSVIRMCRSAGIVLVIGIHHSAFWGSMINQQNAYAYAKWLGTRYKDEPNIVWCPSYAGYLTGTLLNLLIKGIKDGAGNNHLMTRHPDPAYLRPEDYAPWQDSSWLDFQSLQTYQSDNSIPGLVRGMYALTPVKPVVEAEAWYEGDWGLNAYSIRKQTWWTYLSGGYYTYGHTDNWQKVTDWATWVNAPGAQQAVHARTFFSAIDWWNLVPDQSIISGTANLNSAARSSKGDWMCIYLPAGGSITIAMDKLTSGSSAQVSWYRTTDGTFTPAGSFATTGTRQFTTPTGWQDALLFLRTGATSVEQSRSQVVRYERNLNRTVGMRAGVEPGVHVHSSGNRYTLRGARIDGNRRSVPQSHLKAARE